MDGNWSCRQCSNVNYAHREACNRCGAPGGNWNCGECGNLNYSHRMKCNRCEAGRPGAMGGMGGAGGFGGGGMQGGGVSRDPNEMGRAFLQCFMNDPNPVQAAMSFISMNANNPAWFQPRPEYGAYSFPQRGMNGGGGGFPGAVGGMSGNKRARSGPPKAGVDGNWACEKCQNVNLAFRVECNRCKEPKPE